MVGKICVITEGANGIGRCLVEKFTERGASVAFIDKDDDSGSSLVERLGGKALFQPDTGDRQK